MRNRHEESPFQINVRRQMTHPTEIREIDMTLDAETTAHYGISCTELPRIQGTLRNRAGVLILNYSLHCVPAFECDRCLTPVHLPFDGTFEYVVVTETASEEPDQTDYLLAPDAVLDLAEAAMTDLRLSMPTKILCRPDCLGICPVCGTNRNESHCTCESEDIIQQF